MTHTPESKPLTQREQRSAKHTPGPTLIVRLFRRHEAWCKRSGYASMSFAEFKASRMANPLSRAAIAKATGSGT